ncbi:MAG: hypothetical protein H0T78_02540 [Longispora sp.]|nr:hypothetical protein [Longispora sp. (in: high G+C Gram-positive bacteria)]
MNAARTAAVEAALAAPSVKFDPWRRRVDNLLEKGKSPEVEVYIDQLSHWLPEAETLAATLIAKDAAALARLQP